VPAVPGNVEIFLMKKILVTGAAGFIGYHVSKVLSDRGNSVTGIDNLNAYYDVDLKLARLQQLASYENFVFEKTALEDRAHLERLFREGSFDIVINLAAQVGVRHSLKDPYPYIESNITGFANILEGCRQSGVKHLIFASSSSLYGNNTKVPFSVTDNTDHPGSLYAASKKANELMAHTYAHLYGLPCTGLRLFTVYGPWGRPDMAYFKFTKSILEGKPLTVFNAGKMRRDFTYIDDVVEGIIRIVDRVPQPDPSWNGAAPDPGSSYAPYRLYNIGSSNPVEMMKFIELLENTLQKKANMTMLPMQPGDVPATYADISELARETGFKPSTSLEEGIKKFIAWYRGHYR